MINPDPNYQELELDFYFYAGGTDDLTCDFCRERAGKYFHYIEILSWGKGFEKIVIDTCGCMEADGWAYPPHAIVSISVFAVPKDVLVRNIKSGNYKPDKFETDLLGITELIK